MTVVLRAEPAPRPATLVIHMGAGAVESVVNATIRNYGEYRAATADGRGLLAVSVFAVTDGVSEATILDALPQRSFARTTAGAVVDAGFGLLASSIEDPDLDPAIAAIQHVHFDVVLPALDDDRLGTLDPIDDEELELAVRAHVAPHAERLVALFGPRLRR